MTILMVTHEADVAARAERVLHFQDGRIAAG
jgi:predicted ABC-type transport system involved in lysophospholipase L1 biosynthesis ATPase subunit